MGQPRQRGTLVSPHIIQRPDLQTLRQRFGDSFLTFLFWLAWFYLWIPLISLGAWAFGVNLFHDEMVVSAGLQALIELLGLYFLVIFLISATLGIWALINLWRFRGNERRGAQPIVDEAALANDFGVTSEKIVAWQRCKRLVISHDADGNIIAVEPAPVDQSSLHPLEKKCNEERGMASPSVSSS